MSFQIMGIHKQQSHMVKVHTGCNALICFKGFPSALHLYRIMDIVYYDDTLLDHTRKEEIGITQRSLIGMVCIDIRQVNILARII